jgi:Domain of unknown function (DUF1772)
MFSGQLALVIAAIFTGAAIYVSAAEQPARLKLDGKALLTQWKSSYKRGFAMQAPLALVGFLLGLAAWLQTDINGFLVGAVLLIANWPWTLIAIMPTNNKLMRMEPMDSSPETRALIEKWGSLHAVRIVLGVLATIVFFFACISPYE